MSTRYVYALKNIDFPTSTLTVSQEKWQSQNYWPGDVCSNYTIEVDEASGLAKFVPSGNSLQLPSITYRYSTSTYPYVICNSYAINSYHQTVLTSSVLLSAPSGYYWETLVSSSSGSSWYSASVYCRNGNSDSAAKVSFTRETASISPGSSTYGYKSSSSKSLTEGVITENGQQGYLQYLGSDTIDPSSVTYSTTAPTAGKSITINATKRTPTYGGTIYYQFSYSTDGGNSWTDIGSKSKTASASVTIPSGATQFMGRVRASDDWGFTSSTYVTGSNLTVYKPVTYYKVTLFVSPSEGGTATGAGTYSSGSSVTVRATPNDGYKFLRWEKDGSSVSTSSSYTFRLYGNTSLTAVFETALRAYVGIGEKAVALKKGYVGIGGVAKELVKGYVGVGGAAKKLF